MRFRSCVCVVLLVSALAVASSAAESAPAAPARPVLTGTYRVERGVRVLRLWGTPRERGFAQGWLLAKEIVTGFNRGLPRTLGDRLPLYEKRILPLAGLGFSFSKAEEEELLGIVEGIRDRLPPEERRLACLSREIALADLKALNTFGDWCALGCSSEAVWGARTPDGTPAVVRNFDFTALDLLVPGQVVRIEAPSAGRRGWVGISHPGSIGAMTALSEAGVFAAIHDVRVPPAGSVLLRKNVPRLVTVRRLVERLAPGGAVEGALRLCREFPSLYGNNILVATPAPGPGLPAGVVEYDSRRGMRDGADLRGPVRTDGKLEDHVACTNHYRLRGKGDGRRYRALLAGLAARGGTPFDVKGLFALASRAAVPGPGRPVSPGGFGTLHQVVALTGRRVLWVRLLAPGRNIRDIEPAAFDLAREMASVTPKAQKEGK